MSTRAWIAIAASTLAACAPAAPCPSLAEASAPAQADAAAPDREGFSVATSIPASLDPAALERIRQRAKSEHSSALVVIADGAIVAEDYFGFDPDKPRMAMSVTKSVVALGLGVFVGRGFLDLDKPLSTWIPELASSAAADKSAITLRHLMNHTSGLTTARAGAKQEDWWTHSIEEHVLGSKLESEVGSSFVYNNNATDFISVVVRRANPEHAFFDDLLDFTLFAPLGVHATGWSKDAKGDPRTSGELQIRAIDLAKIGQLLLDRGKWRGASLVPESFIDELERPGQSITDQCGLLWWRDGKPKTVFLNDRRLGVWRSAGADSAVIEKAASLVGKTFPSRGAAREALAALVGEEAVSALEELLKKRHSRMFEQTTDVLAYRADGWLGQYVIVVPSARLVAVRMRDPRESSWNDQEYNYDDFRWDVLDLARVSVPVADR
ncbi:MAG: serine hydrolase [Polyangiaceae bacterium]